MRRPLLASRTIPQDRFVSRLRYRASVSSSYNVQHAPIGAFASTVPLAGPVQIELLEQAEGGETQLLGTLAWTPPQRATPPRPGRGGYRFDVADER